MIPTYEIIEKNQWLKIVERLVPTIHHTYVMHACVAGVDGGKANTTSPMLVKKAFSFLLIISTTFHPFRSPT